MSELFLVATRSKVGLVRLLPYLAWISFLLLLGFANLDRIPPVWWDEGWTLTVARNWVEQGHFGQMRMGQLLPPGLAAGFPVIAPISLSFRLFGVGLWQGRLPGVLLTLVSLAILFYLARRLYDRPTAWVTMFVVLGMPAAVQLHPFLNGRQAMGELPVIGYLLTGYALLLLALDRVAAARTGPSRVKNLVLSSAYSLLAMLIWSVAIRTKAQVPPFWYLSLAFASLYAFIKRWRVEALMVLLCLLGGRYAATLVVGRIQTLVTAGPTLPGDPLQGLYSVTATVLEPAIRLKALNTLLVLGLPLVLGVALAAWTGWKGLRKHTDGEPGVEIIRIAMLTFVAGWIGWYLCLGMYWDRYLFPAIFLGSPFTAAILTRLTNGWRFQSIRANIVAGLNQGQAWTRRRRIFYQGLMGFVTWIWVGSMVLMTLVVFLYALVNRETGAAQQVVEYMDRAISTESVVETYESELFFLLPRTYHYPPDQVHVDLIQRAMIDPNRAIDYDPLQADPDYLVVGRFSQEWGLYDQAAASDDFRLIYEKFPYQVYERVRR